MICDDLKNIDNYALIMIELYETIISQADFVKVMKIQLSGYFSNG